MDLKKALEVVADCGPASPRNLGQLSSDSKVKAWHMLKTYLTEAEKHDLIVEFRQIRQDGRDSYTATIAAISARLVTEGQLDVYED